MAISEQPYSNLKQHHVLTNSALLHQREFKAQVCRCVNVQMEAQVILLPAHRTVLFGVCLLVLEFLSGQPQSRPMPLVSYNSSQQCN